MLLFAGLLYDTPEQAWLECALHYITAGGNCCADDTHEFLNTCHRDPVMVLSEMVIDAWEWPGTPDTDEKELAIEYAIEQWEQQL